MIFPPQSPRPFSPYSRF
ncbi:hypothetical protein EYF80_067857 [Liparis tanakae]|uniref:Uncharacterized protein n=1 Tax=Liparis tanakae TaxID=230148 RepID=A0A4Z2E0L6_9TELE|nr:hypothetical protein EYF80_067857 [Liparis tanakae]